MRKDIIYLLISLLVTACGSTAERSVISLKVIAPEPYNTDTTKIFIAGNFNAWDPADSAFMMEYKGEGVFELTKTFPARTKGNFEYKYTRGSWATNLSILR